MINTMPVLTEEKREDLIKFCQDIIEYVNYPQQQALMARIALASLEAESKTVRLFGAIGVDENCWVECEEDEEGATQHYTAPPVPVLKPIALPNIRIFCNSNKSCRKAGYAIADAIRAAGYEVTE